MIKSELRRLYLQKRAELSADERDEASRRIAGRFFETFDLSFVKVLHCFIPIAKLNEIDTALIYGRVWNDFPLIRTAAPRLDGYRGEIRNIAFGSGTELIENAWGIHEPASAEIIPANEIDIVIVPLLSFDEAGNRVGYGKGYYDKFLSRCRDNCVKVGVSYFPPVPEIGDVKEHDVVLDHCLSPYKSYRFRS